MATLNMKNDFPTLYKVAQRLGPDGKIPEIIELLSQENEILTDMAWKEGNLPTGHMSVLRTDLPEVYWRRYNEGVDISSSETAEITDTCGMMETFAYIDSSLAKLDGNEREFRASEAVAFLEAFNQEMARSLFYATGNEKFRGLATRYSDTTSDNPYKDYILDGAGRGNSNTSIWLCGWAEKSGFGIFPKGSVAGFQHRDLGEEVVDMGNGKKMLAYRDHFKWDCGLTVRDGRYFVRIANVDVTQLKKDAQSGADLVDLMTQACEQIWSLSGVRPVFYMNRTVRSFLRRQRIHFPNVQLTPNQVSGQMELSFDEIPIRRVDQLINTESTVSFT